MQKAFIEYFMFFLFFFAAIAIFLLQPKLLVNI